MSWRSRRQGAYFGVFILLCVLVVSVIIYPIVFKTPTCSDKKQNGFETGIDCGGQCQLYCPKTIPLPQSVWATVFYVNEDVYNVVAMLNSTAPSAGARNAGYTFTLYDEAGKILREVKGNTFIPPASSFSIFEPQVRTNQRTPVRVRFSWDDETIYFEKTKFNSNSLPIDVSLWKRDTVLNTERLTVKVSNNSLYPIGDSEYIVIVYDENNEPIASSKTVVSLPARGEVDLFFSWPYQFKKEPKRYELIKRIDPFTYVQ